MDRYMDGRMEVLIISPFFFFKKSVGIIMSDMITYYLLCIKKDLPGPEEVV